MAASNGSSRANGASDAFDLDAYVREHWNDNREESIRFQKDWRWFIKHRDLVHQNPHRWIAIYGQRIIAAADTAEEMRQVILAQGLEPGKTLRVPFGGRGDAGQSAS